MSKPLVFGSPEANAIVEQLRRIAAMPEYERKKHEPAALQEEIRYADARIEQARREILTWELKRAELVRELDTWRLL